MSLPEIFCLNSLSGKREKFSPQIPGEVSIYGCGPTVYGLTHVGNARAALTVDLVAKVFKLAGYNVKLARNITDIDDKIIKVAAQTQTSWQNVVEKYTNAYRSELQTLQVEAPTFEPKVTEHLNDIHKIITKLIELNAAYAAETPFGTDVYFAVSSFQSYGKLSKRKTDDLRVGVRIEPGESKRDPLDFALWKAAKPGEPSWESPWGPGRPGWHIECSAMIASIFGDQIDIHMGGIDLIFPHHENEIAQSEACSKKPLAHYWIHNGMLTLGREKMSKSLGNIFTTQAFLEKYGPEVLRLMCLQHHYRAPMDFSDESIIRAEGLLERLYRGKQHSLKSNTNSSLPAPWKDQLDQLSKVLFDDFNSAKAMGLILGALRVCYKESSAELWAMWWKQSQPYFEKVFSILGDDPEVALKNIRKRKLLRLGITDQLAQEIDQKLESRELLRKEKKFDEADRVRKELEARGFLIMDGPDGSSWSLPEKTLGA